MRITRHHVVGLGGDGACEHRVVVGVIGDGWWDDRWHDHRGQGGIALDDLGRG